MLVSELGAGKENWGPEKKSDLKTGDWNILLLSKYGPEKNYEPHIWDCPWFILHPSPQSLLSIAPKLDLKLDLL